LSNLCFPEEEEYLQEFAFLRFEELGELSFLLLRLLWLGFSDFADKAEEDFVNVVTILCTGFEERAVKLLGHCETFDGKHLAFVFQVALVANDDHWNHFLSFLNALNLFAKGFQFFERGAVGDRVHEDEALASSEVLVTHGGKLFLPRRVQNIQQASLAVNVYLFSVRVFDGLLQKKKKRE
jgi:hypothetical protein